MKKIFLGVAFLSAFAFVQAQTVDEIVDKHVAAIGGKDKISQLQNVVMEGSVSAQGMSVNLTFTRVPGKLLRQDINIPAASMSGYDLTTDKEGWTFMPFAGQPAPVQKTGDTLKQAQRLLSLFSDDGLYDYKAKGNKIELQGKEDVGGTDALKLKVTDAAGEVSTVYIDPATYYIIRTSTVRKMNGQEFPISVDLTDYKDVEGIKFPFSMGSMQGNVIFSSIKVNQTIDEKKYKPE